MRDIEDREERRNLCRIWTQFPLLVRSVGKSSVFRTGIADFEPESANGLGSQVQLARQKEIFFGTHTFGKVGEATGTIDRRVGGDGLEPPAYSL